MALYIQPWIFTWQMVAFITHMDPHIHLKTTHKYLPATNQVLRSECLPFIARPTNWNGGRWSARCGLNLCSTHA